MVIVLAGVLGGQPWPADADLVAQLGLWRIGNPDGARLMIWLTQLGGSFVLVPLTLGIALFLAVQRQHQRAILLLGSTFSGRLMIELIKWTVDRPRPDFDPAPVFVSSQSFPSGHAGNSTITYLAIALFAVPERWRSLGLTAAAVLALAVGATRPILGVHWPSDVVGGWAFGVLWVLLFCRFSRHV
jgi:undecaprenyl-diphosphatase